MAEPVPCPNPACTAVFTPESLRGATRFTCPRCGTLFQFRATPEPASASRSSGGRSTARRGEGAASSGAPRPPESNARLATMQPADPATTNTIPPSRTQQRIPPKSAAKVVDPPAPPPPGAAPAEAPPAADTPATFQFAPEPEGGGIIVRRESPKRRNARRVATLLLIALAAGGVLATGYKWFYSAKLGDAAGGSERMEGAYQFVPPGKDWKKDTDLRLRMQVGGAWRRSRDAAAMAFLARDYKTRLPGEGELIGDALARLRLQFKRVDWERSPVEALLGGQPAQAIDFDATDAEEVDVRGRAYLLGYRGYGYWLFLWSPSGDGGQAAADAELVRAAFALNPTFREGWQEKAPELEPLAVPQGGVALSYPKAVWVEEEKAGYDPKAVQVLKGSFSVDGTGKHRDWTASRVASAQVLVIPVADGKGPGEAARAYVLESQKDPDRGGYPKTTLQPIKNKAGEAQDHDADLGDLRGRLTKLQMANTEDRERFVVLGVVPRPEKGRLLVVWCECDWAMRDYWEPEFVILLNSLRPLKDGEAEPPAEKKKQEKEAPPKDDDTP
jgi:hypothetical protein